MSSEEPAPKVQKKRARALGLVFPSNIARDQLSGMIARALAERDAGPASEGLKELAEDLGIKFDDLITYGELAGLVSRKVNRYIKKARKSTLKPGTVVIYDGKFYKVVSLGKERGRFRVRLRPFPPQRDMRTVSVKIIDFIAKTARVATDWERERARERHDDK